MSFLLLMAHRRIQSESISSRKYENNPSSLVHVCSRFTCARRHHGFFMQPLIEIPPGAIACRSDLSQRSSINRPDKRSEGEYANQPRLWEPADALRVP